jgi:hypothetical protein
MTVKDVKKFIQESEKEVGLSPQSSALIRLEGRNYPIDYIMLNSDGLVFVTKKDNMRKMR